MILDTKPVVIDGKTTYDVPSHLEFIRKVGSGAYGTVASFRDPQTGMHRVLSLSACVIR
jgi:hypothetical protein